MADNTFDTWALVELMGHSRIAGRVTDATIGGATFIRVDVPETSGGQPSHTRYFSPAAIYGISPVTEEIARGLAEELDNRPFNVYELPRRLQELESPSDVLPTDSPF